MRVIIVGAGLDGLTCVKASKAQSREVIVLEASDGEYRSMLSGEAPGA